MCVQFNSQLNFILYAYILFDDYYYDVVGVFMQLVIIKWCLSFVLFDISIVVCDCLLPQLTRSIFI